MLVQETEREGKKLGRYVVKISVISFFCRFIVYILLVKRLLLLEFISE